MPKRADELIVEWYHDASIAEFVRFDGLFDGHGELVPQPPLVQVRERLELGRKAGVLSLGGLQVAHHLLVPHGDKQQRSAGPKSMSHRFIHAILPPPTTPKWTQSSLQDCCMHRPGRGNSPGLRARRPPSALSTGSLALRSAGGGGTGGGGGRGPGRRAARATGNGLPPPSGAAPPDMTSDFFIYPLPARPPLSVPYLPSAWMPTSSLFSVVRPVPAQYLDAYHFLVLRGRPGTRYAGSDAGDGGTRAPEGGGPTAS